MADDFSKIMILRSIFAKMLPAMNDPQYPEWAIAYGKPVVLAASKACLYDGRYGPAVRKYYAFLGDFSIVWFTRDALATIPDCLETCVSRAELQFAIRQIAKGLLNERYPGLGEIFKL